MDCRFFRHLSIGLILAIGLGSRETRGAEEVPPGALAPSSLPAKKMSVLQPVEKQGFSAVSGEALVGHAKIWSAVIFATNEPHPSETPTELKSYARQLKKIFGYNNFQVIGSATKGIGAESEDWLVPSQNFWLGVKARRTNSKEARGGYLLSLQLFQDHRPLVNTEAKLAPESPLVIRGPGYGNGQIVIVLKVLR